jgi:hypothetical protein
MNRGKTFVAAIGLSIAMVMTSACGAVTSMIGGGGGAAANELWSDVPQMPGMTKQSGDLPLPIRLGMQAMMQAMASSESGSLDNVEFLTFTTTQTAEELRSFYSTEAMSALGWTMPGLPGCAGAAAGEQAAALPGEVCIYGRDAGNGKNTILLIMTTRDDGKAESLVYFYRLSGVQMNQPAQ